MNLLSFTSTIPYFPRKAIYRRRLNLPLSLADSSYDEDDDDDEEDDDDDDEDDDDDDDDDDFDVNGGEVEDDPSKDE